MGAKWAAGLLLLGSPLFLHAENLNKSFVAQPFLDTALGGTTSAARPELAGTVVEDVLQPFSFLGVSGSVQNRVVREDGSGTLDFYWRINVDPNASTVNIPNAISAFRLIDFGYDKINDADWRSDGLGSAAPHTGRVFNPASEPSGAINFLFSDGLVLPGDPSVASSGSRFFFLHTDATEYAKTAEYDLLDRAQNLSTIFSTFAPATNAVPDGGSSLGMLVLGVAGLCWRVRRS